MTLCDFDPGLRTREAYRIWMREYVRFNDLDALGHVSSVRTNEFFASARTRLFQAAIPQWPRSPVVPVLKLSTVRHDGEIGYPCDLEVGLTVEGFGTTSVRMVLAVFDGDRCPALCRNVFVFIDTASRRPVSPDVVLKDRFLELAG